MRASTPHAAADQGREALVDSTVRVIASAKRRLKPRDLFRQSSVIRVLTVRDFKTKYKQSALGPLWLIFQPLALLVVFLVAFRGGTVKPGQPPYLVFALTGLMSWSYFQAAMTFGTASLITNSSFVRFTPCPRLAFPIAAIIASLPSFGITAVAGVFGAAVSGFLSPRVLLTPILLIWVMVLTAGVVGFFSALAVRYRDILNALPSVLQLGAFIAPVGYTLASLSPTARTIVEINPISGLTEATRWIVISGYHASIAPIVISLGVTSAVAVAGWLVFTRAETTMADVI